MKDKLIKNVIECLEREYDGKYPLDIPFMIITLEQCLGDERYSELLSDCSKYDYYLNYIEPEKDQYYTNGYIEVELSEKSEEDDEEDYCDYLCKVLNYEYKIEFNNEPRHWGYCECQEGDKDYDARYRCCGHGCDWTAPAISIHKIIHMGNSSFDGDEHDYWDYKDKYNNITQKDKEEAEKQARIKFLVEEKARIERQLSKLTKQEE